MILTDIYQDEKLGSKWTLVFEDDMGAKVMELYIPDCDIGFLVKRVLDTRRRGGRQRLK